MLDLTNDEVDSLVARETTRMHHQKPESEQSKAGEQATTGKLQLEALWEPCKEPALVPECGVGGSQIAGYDLPDRCSGVHGASTMRRPTRARSWARIDETARIGSVSRGVSQALMAAMAVCHQTARLSSRLFAADTVVLLLEELT